ncbi:metallophosphoesterase [Denitrovibrio acetiphilus DSM 12809]|uniref:Metallophosphoesterase n=1 Tax=Denitrovibrio acetiphilus (strain DSM 12809 / NBRC 114555 / N2460) TaxID=522772 RepID=D4H533_DENA2|nr:metallophosphoesterase [Denitrovibrio acetiphilus]ADD69389.1 metallophosphoesterase [Denitrovibrio acetiphilus DSM 12809]
MSKKCIKDFSGLSRRQFLKYSAASASFVAASSLVGCGGDSDSSTPETIAKSTLPSANAWKFGIISDTQWTKDDDGENPASCAVDIINALNAKFVEHDVDLVVHVGDLTDDGRHDFQAYNTKTALTYDYTTADAMGVRARYVQELYNNGIGYFPLRGNHDNSAEAATEFLNFFPQTRTGVQNDGTVQEAAYAAKNPDESYLPNITRTNLLPFNVGSNFSTASHMEGLTYSFDYNNLRFVMLDHFTATDDAEYPISTQQSWIDSTLSGRASGTHAIVFAHKGLITQNHDDNLFGEPAEAGYDYDADDNFIESLANNNVRYYINGHDHMHDRSYVATNDGTTAKVTQLVTASDSSKFYTPQEIPNDVQYFGGVRQTMLSQELYKIGYYIVTVDGDHLTIDYYGAPSYISETGETFSTTPDLKFTKRESFGYSLNGKDFLVAYNESYTDVDVTSANGTRAVILDGINGRTNRDFAGRVLNVEVNTGFYDADEATSSDILYLRGMQASLGSDYTETFTLSMSYSDENVTEEEIDAQSFGLARYTKNGEWENAVFANSDGVTTFVKGSWAEGYDLGTWGVDTSSKTVWAVINTNGYFAAVKNI